MKLPFNVQALSPSALGVWKTCPLEWWMRKKHGTYVQGPYAFLGECGHKALEDNYTHRLAHGAALPVELLLDIFTTSYVLGEINIEWGDLDQDQLVDSFRRALEAFHRDGEDLYTPIQVEKKFRFEIPPVEEGDPTVIVVGRLDFYGKLVDTGEEVVLDWKFSKSKKHEAKKSHQLTTYALAMEAEGKKVQCVAVGRMVYGVKKPYFVEDVATRRGSDYYRVIEEYRQMWKALLKFGDDPKNYPLAPPGFWKCDKWCDWKDKCPRGGNNTFGL